MACLQYHYNNPQDEEKYKIDCRNMKFKNLNDIDKFNNKDLLEFINKTYSDEAFIEDSPFTFSEEYINKNNSEICKSTNMTLGPQQKFMGQLLGPESNFNNILIYHGLGSGKSCTSIVIGEALKNSTNQRILYVVPAPLQEQYYEEIAGEIRNGKFFSCPSFCLVRDSDNNLERDYYVSQTKNKILIEKQNLVEKEIEKLRDIEILIEDGDISPATAKKYKTQETLVSKLKMELRNYQAIIRKNIIKTFEITSHTKFIESLYKTGANGQFIKNSGLKEDSTLFRENGLLIIDEIQRLVSSGGTLYTKLYDSIKYYFHPNLKLVLMSATPIYDNPYELALTINLLRPRVPFPTKASEFYKYFIGERDGTDCNIQTKVKTYISPNSCIINEELIKYICSGYISYFKGGNPNAYPYKRVITLMHPFSNEHKTEYIDALSSDVARDTSVNKQSGEGTSNYENVLLGNYDNVDDDKVSGMFVTTQQYSNIFLPRVGDKVNKTLEDKKNALRMFKNNIKSMKNNTEILTYIKKLSAKFASIIELTIDSKGPVFIFSNWLNYGVEPLAIILDALGFSNFEGTSSKNKEDNKYFIWSSETKTRDPTGDLIKRARNTFNSSDNSNGKLLKVILGTRSVMEGVSFKNVKQVHITDPWWNESRIEQILARASRYCSHSGLPWDEQYVDIYRHYSVFPVEYGEIDQEANDAIQNWKNLASESIDVKMLGSALKKYAINNDFEKLIKSCSIDCNINKNGNITRLEEYCIPVGGGMYQIHYKDPYNGRMYIREGIPDLLTFEQIYNREFSFPRKDLPIRFIEAGMQGGVDGYNILTRYDDSRELYEPDIDANLNMKENITPWDSDKKLSDLELTPDVRKYILNLHNNFNLLPDLRRKYLKETGDKTIQFQDDPKSKQELIKCIKDMSINDIVSDSVKRKIAEKFELNNKKKKINSKVLELIRLGGATESQLEELLLIGINNPGLIEEAIQIRKNSK